MYDVSRIRKALIEAIPYTTANYEETSETLDIGDIYMPPTHEKALRLETSLVIGSRGVGKSFLAAAINDEKIRSELGNSIHELKNASVYIGFSTKDDIDAYPDKETFTQLLGQGFTPYEIWRAVAARWMSNATCSDIPSRDWPDTVKWVRDNPEQVTRLFQSANAVFELEGKRALILFDALDRCSDNWQEMNNIVRDLLRVTLWLKPYSNICTKVFLRPDQISAQTMDFPDASKIWATKVEITWKNRDLHGLLWQLLCNAHGDSGILFRNIYAEILGEQPIRKEHMWSLAEKVKLDETVQRDLFKKLVEGAKTMTGFARVAKRLVNGDRQALPRAFLATIRNAAKDSLE
jgi:hypothetical protein